MGVDALMELREGVLGVVAQCAELPNMTVGCAVMVIESDVGCIIVSNVGASDDAPPSDDEVTRVIVAVLMEAVNKLTSNPTVTLP